MYPRNAASPERIAVGAVILIADGTVQTSAVLITVVPQGGVSAAGLGTTSYEQGIVFYLPTQAETNFASFIVTAYKASCIPVAVTVVTTGSATAGRVLLSGETHTGAVIPTVSAVTGLTAANLDAAVSTRATPTNITAATGIVLSGVTHTGAVIPTVTTLTGLTAATVHADLDDIQARLPAALVGGRIDASAGAMAANVITAASMADGAIDNATFAADTGLVTIRSNTAQAGAATAITLDAAASAVNSFYNNALVILTGGTGVGQSRFISAYDGTTKVATVATWATNPAAGTTFAIRQFDAVAGASAPTAAQNATAVWDKARSAHVTVGTFGEGAASVQGNVTGSVGSVTGAVGSVTGGVTVSTNNDKSGYALTQTFPANFSSMSISVTTGLVDITQAGADKAWGTAARLLTAGTNIALAKGVGLTGLNDLSAAGVAAATWDAATATYGAAGTYGLLVETNLDTTISSRMATYTQPAGFLAGTFPAGTIANTTNITAAAGIVLSGVTHTGAVIPTVATVSGAVGSVSGGVAGSVASVSGAVGSVTARVTANTDQINGVATAAARLALSTQGIVTGTVGAASTTTSIVTSALDPAAAVTDQYKGRIVTFKQDTATANLRGQSTDITANTALGVLTVTALTTAPASADTFTIT